MFVAWSFVVCSFPCVRRRLFLWRPLCTPPVSSYDNVLSYGSHDPGSHDLFECLSCVSVLLWPLGTLLCKRCGEQGTNSPLLQLSSSTELAVLLWFKCCKEFCKLFDWLILLLLLSLALWCPGRDPFGWKEVGWKVKNVIKVWYHFELMT